MLGRVPAKLGTGDQCKGHFVTMLGYGRPDRESLNIGPPAGRRPVGELMLSLA